ncbi:MAG: 16S rRNA (adenine(1518)-N(6)/adenine(1519)-N(6))-dimethyltransferase RsmA [Methanocorpusculum sp.]|nr:16S rRNA (adenine(1518)-N(6)/adenine(1519)-N(6))-dimethyltransferase RsmA [Methanocorpusculum sp.]
MKAPKDQHFLIDFDAVNRIADTVPVAGRNVLEIGPGGGVLTEALLARGANVRAVELDGTLLPNLEERFCEELKSGQLTITRGDASKVELPPFDLVVANLPYSISSKITFRLLDIGFESAVLMYQLEFAKRMAAAFGDKEYGRLSVMAQTYSDVEFVMELPPNAFNPQPEVWSAVVKITPHEPPVPIKNKKVFEDVVRELFSHRRKTVRNCLKSLGKKYNIDNLMTNISEEILNLRPEMLSVEKFIEMSNLIE